MGSRDESGIPRLINIMRDSPGLVGFSGIKRDQVRQAGFHGNVFCPRVAQVPARRSRHRAPNARGQCVAPCNIRRTRCPHPAMRGPARTCPDLIRVSGYPRIHSSMRSPSHRRTSRSRSHALALPPHPVMRGLDPRIHVRRHDGSTWMPRTSRGMTTRGGGQAERTPRDESGIPRLLKFMRDSPGLGGILRDKVGSSEISGIPRQCFLPEGRPSARPTFLSSRTQRAWTVRRAPQHPSHAMPPCRHARTCPDLIRVSGYPRIHMATPPATAHSLAHRMPRNPGTAPAR